MSEYVQSRQAERKKLYKKGLDANEARLKRNEDAVRLRKDKRLESFQKRRNLGGGEDQGFSAGGQGQDEFGGSRDDGKGWAATPAERVCPSH